MNQIQQNAGRTMVKRRALSPKISNTYIALSNVNIQNDRYQEQPINLKLKLIRAYVQSRKNPNVNQNNFDSFKSQKVDKEELSDKNDMLLSMMKRYTYKYLKSPQDENGAIFLKNNNQERRQREFTSDRKEVKELCFSDEDTSNKIIFGSPFYKKRTRVASKFRDFDKIVTEKEIKEYSKRILNHISSSRVCPSI